MPPRRYEYHRAKRDCTYLGVKHINAPHNTVQAWHGEGVVALILTHPCIHAGYLLICGRDDEVGRVHGDEVGSELARKVVLLLQRLPVDVRIWVLGLFQSMSNVALHTQHKTVTHTVLLFSTLIKTFLGYFDPENIFFR